MPRRTAYDRWLFVTTVLLVLGGSFMVGSSTGVLAMEHGLSPSAFWLKHALILGLGLGAFAVAASIRYQVLADRRLLALMLLVTAGALIFVLLMPEAGGARRWIPLGPIKVQPSEFAKLVSIVFTASLLARKESQIDDPWAVQLPAVLVVGGMALLVVVEPDLGSAVIPVLVAGLLLFVAGLRWLTIAGMALAGAAAFALAVLAEPYRMRRLSSFLDPWADAQDSGYQLVQSFVALGRGGLTGVGFGDGIQKNFFLPAAHTDFIYSMIGEEFGLLGTLAVLAAFLLIFWRGVRAARRAPDRFGFYLALGMTLLLVLQALVNISVCIGLLPTKGLPLPFISYGGSSLLASMTAMGLLVNVSRHSN